MTYKKDYSKDTLLNAKITELHITQKHNFKETAKIIGISREKARRHLEANGYKIQKYNRKKELDSSFARKISLLYYNHKLTQKEVAEKLDCNRKKIIKYMKTFNMKARNPKQYFTEEQEWMHKRVVYWYKRGLMISFVAKIEGIPYSTSYSILNRNQMLDKYKIIQPGRKQTKHFKGIVFMAIQNRKKYREFANKRIKQQTYNNIGPKIIDKIDEFQPVQQIETQEAKI